LVRGGPEWVRSSGWKRIIWGAISQAIPRPIALPSPLPIRLAFHLAVLAAVQLLKQAPRHPLEGGRGGIDHHPARSQADYPIEARQQIRAVQAE
jgi:hypothetical protein